MKFLEKYDFNKEDINEFMEMTPPKMMKLFTENKDVIESNLAYIKELGVKTFREIFIFYPELFLKDPSDFEGMLNQYVKESLVEKLNNNYRMIEYL